MDIGPYPTFSWSHSRASTFQSCRRRYYWTYYGSWLGWSRDAPEEARTSYRLKKLTTLQMLVGLQVHERAREIALAVSAGEAMPDLDTLWERTRNELNRVWLASRDVEGFLRHPSRHPMLAEVFSKQPIPNDRLLATRAKALRCLGHLRESVVWEEATCSDAVHLYDATHPADFAGVPIYAAPDLVYRRASGEWVIVDWKTGATDHAREQIAAYALFLSIGPSPGDFAGIGLGRTVNLDRGSHEDFEITHSHLRAAERRIEDSLWRMRGLIVDLDTARNEAHSRSHFPVSPNPSMCRWCPFLELCEPELECAEHAGPF